MQVGHARLLGECYNYRLLPSRVVMDTLHLALALGHGGDGAASFAADPPTSYFRIRCLALPAPLPKPPPPKAPWRPFFATLPRHASALTMPARHGQRGRRHRHRLPQWWG